MPTIRELREAKGLSQEELAVQAGVTRMTVGRMESGEPVQKSTVRLVSQALGVKPEELAGVNIVYRVSKNAKQ